MSRLIEADNLKKLFRDISNHIKAVRGDGKCFFTVESALKVIDQAPTVDAVPVIRCKDCKYWETMPEGMKDCSNSQGIAYPKDNDFCSYGERKDDEN